MFGFGEMIEKLKKNPKRIVLTDGSDPRILEAASRLLASNFIKPVLLGNAAKVERSAEEAGYNIRGAEIIEPKTYEKFDEMADLYYEMRKEKGMTAERARELMLEEHYFGTMLVKMKEVDCLLVSSTYSTAEIVRPALQIIKTRHPGKIASSCMILVRPSATGENEVLAMADCALNIRPTEDELVTICADTVECARAFGMEPKVAFLSYSTLGSGKGEDVDRMRNAANKAKEELKDVPIEGELQFDTAVSPRVARTKCPGSKVAGYANTFIFPDLYAGNIGSKIAQRMGNFEAYGPILLGLNAQINYLPRGCNALEVYSMCIVTAALSI